MYQALPSLATYGAWANILISLSLSLLIFKMEIIILLQLYCRENEKQLDSKRLFINDDFLFCHRNLPRVINFYFYHIYFFKGFRSRFNSPIMIR